MVAVDMETGEEDVMPGKMVEFYESEVDATVKVLTSIIEPLMIVVVGGLIIVKYLPMFEIYKFIA